MNALGFLDTRVLNHALLGRINAVRADQKINVPVVMTREEVAAVISLLDGTAPLVAIHLYGSGLRIMEAGRLTVKDIDDQMKPLTVRSGKGDKDRFTTLPAMLTPVLQHHLAGVKTRHQQDSAQGHGEVYLPHALARKSPHAAKEWGWQSNPRHNFRYVCGSLSRPYRLIVTPQNCRPCLFHIESLILPLYGPEGSSS
jgi:integrase